MRNVENTELMALVLAIEPDPRQAATVRRVIHDRVGVELVLVATKDKAIEAIARQIPDLILTTTLLSPRHESDLHACLRALEDASHVQTVTIPLLATQEAATGRRKKGVFGGLKRQSKTAPAGCDPEVFADEIIGYLEQAREKKEAADYRRAEARQASAAGSGYVESDGLEAAVIQQHEPSTAIAWAPQEESQEHADAPLRPPTLLEAAPEETEQLPAHAGEREELLAGAPVEEELPQEATEQPPAPAVECKERLSEAVTDADLPQSDALGPASDILAADVDLAVETIVEEEPGVVLAPQPFFLRSESLLHAAREDESDEAVEAEAVECARDASGKQGELVFEAAIPDEPSTAVSEQPVQVAADQQGAPSEPVAESAPAMAAECPAEAVPASCSADAYVETRGESLAELPGITSAAIETAVEQACIPVEADEAVVVADTGGRVEVVAEEEPALLSLDLTHPESVAVKDAEAAAPDSNADAVPEPQDEAQDEWLETLAVVMQGFNPASIEVEVGTAAEVADPQLEPDQAEALAAAETLVSPDLAVAAGQITVVPESVPPEVPAQSAPQETWLSAMTAAGPATHADRLWLQLAIEALQVESESGKRLSDWVDEEWRRIGDTTEPVSSIAEAGVEAETSAAPSPAEPPRHTKRKARDLRTGDRAPAISRRATDDQEREAVPPSPVIEASAGASADPGGAASLAAEVDAHDLPDDRRRETPAAKAAPRRYLAARKAAPVAAWARKESEFDVSPVVRPADDLRGLLEGLSLPAPIAGVTYAGGCRIRRVTVPPASDRGRRKSGEPLIILSRKTLRALRKPAREGELLGV